MKSDEKKSEEKDIEVTDDKVTDDKTADATAEDAADYTAEAENGADSTDDSKDSDSMKFLIIGLVVIVVAIAAGFAIVKYLPQKQNTEVFTYNNFLFTKLGGLWWTQVQKGNTIYDVSLHYSPKEVENITVNGSLDSRFNRAGVYLAFDPTVEEQKYVALAAGQLSLNLARAIEMTPVAACTKNITDACANRPIVTCDNTDLPVIFLDITQDARVLLSGNCIIVSGKDREILRAAERLLYYWYGIVN